MDIRYSCFSEPCGKRNEDTIVAKCDLERGKALFVVCDGMSGLYRGDLASKLVGDAFSSIWDEHHGTKSSTWIISHAMESARKSLDMMSRYNAGTTMVLAALDGEEVIIAHLGDSKAFYHRTGEGLLYETSDHVCVSEGGWPYVSKGIFNYGKLEQPDMKVLKARPGDKFLLCSDGVSNCFGSYKLAGMLQESTSTSSSLCEIIVYCDNHASDNYSAIMVEVL
ncbi:MAG: protein phosphatase 2C domain-containing protein [Prevotella sp.]|nr:protein phosphatase 2C domain-containing protein [Prevotella sp.]